MSSTTKFRSVHMVFNMVLFWITAYVSYLHYNPNGNEVTWGMIIMSFLLPIEISFLTGIISSISYLKARSLTAKAYFNMIANADEKRQTEIRDDYYMFNCPIISLETLLYLFIICLSVVADN